MQPAEVQIVLPTDCSICQEPLDEERTVTLPCHESHIFHRSCILEWYDENPVCPLDRTEIPDTAFDIQRTKGQALLFYTSIAAESALFGACCGCTLPWLYVFNKYAAKLAARSAIAPCAIRQLEVSGIRLSPNREIMLSHAITHATIESSIYFNHGLVGLRTYNRDLLKECLRRAVNYCGSTIIKTANSDDDYLLDWYSQRAVMPNVIKGAASTVGFLILRSLLEEKLEMATELMVSQGSKLLAKASEKLLK
jgi:hypothetical protein